MLLTKLTSLQCDHSKTQTTNNTIFTLNVMKKKPQMSSNDPSYENYLVFEGYLFNLSGKSLGRRRFLFMQLSQCFVKDLCI